MRILICSDGSKWAQKSARFALQLFRDTVHELTILVFKQRASGMTPAKKSMTRGTRDKQDNLGADRATEVIAREVEDLVDDLSIDHREIAWRQDEGNMADHLLEIADDYDLICLGGAGKGGYSPNMLGLIADEIVKRGDGNLMVTKTSDDICKKVLVALSPKSIDEDLAHYLGQLFQDSPASVTIDVLWEDLPPRFEGYLDAATGRKMKQMVDSDLFDDPKKLRRIIDVIESYGIDADSSYQDYHSLEELIEDVEPTAYDLLVLRPSTEDSGFLQMIEPSKQSLNLMRKSSTNVMLLRSLPSWADSE